MDFSKGDLTIMDLGFMLNHEQPVSEAMTQSYINAQTQEHLKTCTPLDDEETVARDSPTLAADLYSLTPSPATNSNVPPSLEKFEGFGNLPLELRLTIWDYAMPTPQNGKRVLRVKAYLQNDGKIKFHVCSWNGRSKFRYPATTKEMYLRLSEVCHESRSVYLKMFQNSLQGYKGDTRIRFTNETTVFICNFRKLVNDIRKMDDELKGSESESVGKPPYNYYSDIRILGFHAWYPAPAESPWPEHVFPKVEFIEFYVKNYGRWHRHMPRRTVLERHLEYMELWLAQERSPGWQGPKIVVHDPNVLCFCKSHGPKDCAEFMRTISLDGFTSEVPPLQGNVEAKILHAYWPGGLRV